MTGPVSVSVNNEPVENGPLGEEPIVAAIVPTRVEASIARTSINVQPKSSPVVGVSIAGSGPAGPQGPPGLPFVIAPYVWGTDTPETVWTVHHDQGVPMGVQAVQDGLVPLFPTSIDFPDVNTVVLTFGEPSKGRVFLWPLGPTG